MKKFVALLLAFVAMAALSLGATGCNPKLFETETEYVVETEDFLFKIYEKENYALLYSLTEKGMEKEILKVPAFVKGYPVKRFGLQTVLMYQAPWFRSKNLKKIYFPYTCEYFTDAPLFDGVGIHDNVEIVCVNNDLSYLDSSGGKVTVAYISKNYETATIIYSSLHFDSALKIIEKWLNKDPKRQDENYGGSNVFYKIYHDINREKYLMLANCFYHFNFSQSPNNDIFWIDYIYEDCLYLAPDEPTRKGYTFAGWYTEPECENEWNGEYTVPEEDQTFNFYAKWTENKKPSKEEIISQGEETNE